MDTPTLLSNTIQEVAAKIHALEISPVELTVAQLNLIEELDRDLRCFALLTPEIALKQARQAERELRAGFVRSALHGIPIALKDVIDVADLPTAAGMQIHLGRIAKRNSTVYRRLRQSGAVLLGKTHLTEGAYAEHRQPLGAPVNPWEPSRWPGASSSGSGVAVAAGLAFGALGSDTGASIRLPSAVNGLVGIRPTWGRVSRRGVFELAGTLDQVGPMARTVQDAALILAAIAGPDSLDPTTALGKPAVLSERTESGLDGLIVGVDREYTSIGVEDVITHAFDEFLLTLEAQGAILAEVRFPDPSEAIDDWFGVCAVEAARAHSEFFPARKEEYGPGLRDLLRLGHRLSAVEYQRMLVRRADFRGRVAKFFCGMDLLATPVLAFATPTSEKMTRRETDTVAGAHKFTYPFPMSGNPTITLPAGFDRDGLPIGVQLVAPRWREDSLIRAGLAYQEATSWHLARPSLNWRLASSTEAQSRTSVAH